MIDTHVRVVALQSRNGASFGVIASLGSIPRLGADRASGDGFREFLAVAPDVPPIAGDELSS